MNKHQLPTFADFNLNINLEKLQNETDKIIDKFIDVCSANPMLCDNHKNLVKSVYDNFEQINLTTPSSTMSFTSSIKERLKRKEEHLYNIPTPDYIGSYFHEIVSKFKSPASRIRITKLAPGKDIPFHVDYDVNYAVRCICPIYSSNDVINYWKRNGQIEKHVLQPGRAYFLNIGFPHAVYNKSDQPRIALMFSLTENEDIKQFLK